MHEEQIRDALVRDVEQLDAAHVQQVLEAHGWRPHPTASDRTLAFVDPQRQQVSSIPESRGVDPAWYGIQLAVLVGHFAHAHQLSLLEAMTRFGVVGSQNE